jgi:hypothetical protein
MLNEQCTNCGFYSLGMKVTAKSQDLEVVKPQHLNSYFVMCIVCVFQHSLEFELQ